MPWAQHVAHREEGFGADLEFFEVSLGRQIVLQKVTNLGLFNLLDRFFSTADLHCINAILFERFDLSHLAAVQLDDRARNQFSPLVPKVGHAHFVADYARSF